MFNLKIIFRKFKEGDVIALFPTEPATLDPNECTSYQHIGQHGAADVRGMIQATRPALPAEFVPLLAELESIGYDLKVCKRVSRAMNHKRYQTLRAI